MSLGKIARVRQTHWWQVALVCVRTIFDVVGVLIDENGEQDVVRSNVELRHIVAAFSLCLAASASTEAAQSHLSNGDLHKKLVSEALECSTLYCGHTIQVYSVRLTIAAGFRSLEIAQLLCIEDRAPIIYITRFIDGICTP